MKKDFVAVVLAGGIGKRWWPLATYKALFPFFSTTVLATTLERLHTAGVTEAIVVTNKENYEDVKSVHTNGVNIAVAIQKDADGMAGAVLVAKNFVRHRSVFVVNVGDLTDESFFGTLKKALGDTKPFIVGMKVSDYFDTGYLKFYNDRIVGIVEKPGKGNEPSNYIDLVFDYFPNSDLLFNAIEQTKSNRDDVFEKALSMVFAKQVFRVVEYEGYWVPMKYPWHVLEYLDHRLDSLSAYRGKNVLINKNVFIEGPVYIGDNVKIFENSKIIGPSYIGDNTIVGNNNIIRRSHIGINCVTGFNTDITRSYIGAHCWFHSNYIGDSVLEGNVSLGSGTVLANLRLDEGDIYSVVKGERINTKRNKLGAIIARDVHIGVNTSVMPGVKIGSGSFVGAGVILDKDLPEGKFCIGKSEYSVLDNMKKSALDKRNDFRSKLP